MQKVPEMMMNILKKLKKEEEAGGKSKEEIKEI